MDMLEKNNLSPIEKIKQESDGLRGTIVQSVANEITGAVSEDDQALFKFHGMYQQDDRDRREERPTERQITGTIWLQQRASRAPYSRLGTGCATLSRDWEFSE